jgi:hypothetical protein
MPKQWSPITSRSASRSTSILILSAQILRLTAAVSWEAARTAVFSASTRFPNWSSYFYYPGVDRHGFPQFTWQYTMVDRAPFGTDESEESAETTEIRAPVVPVSLDLRNFDGSPRFVGGKRLFSDATQYVSPVLSSPVFSKTFYGSSGIPTQFTDAIQRAEFFNKAASEWHTLLRSSVATPRTMVLVRGTYRFALNADGTCCAIVLIDEGTFINALFPAMATDTTTVMGAAENAGDIRTRDPSTFLFPNAYLFIGGDPNNCCILGFHSFDLEPGGADNGFRERRYVMNYSSWISPGLFGEASAMSPPSATRWLRSSTILLSTTSHPGGSLPTATARTA